MPKGKLITDPEQKYQALHKQRVHSAQKGDIPLPPSSNRSVPNPLSPYLRTIAAGRKKLK